MRTTKKAVMSAGWSVALCLIVVTGFAGAAFSADDTKPVPAATAAAKPEKKHRAPPSACVGLTESACAGKAECFWRKAITTKSGKTRKAHCRKKPVHAAKKAPTT